MEEALKITMSYESLQREGELHDWRDEEHGDHLHNWYLDICKSVEQLTKHTRNVPGVFQGYKELVDMFNYFKRSHQ